MGLLLALPSQENLLFPSSCPVVLFSNCWWKNHCDTLQEGKFTFFPQHVTKIQVTPEPGPSYHAISLRTFYSTENYFCNQLKHLLILLCRAILQLPRTHTESLLNGLTFLLTMTSDQIIPLRANGAFRLSLFSP